MTEYQWTTVFGDNLACILREKGMSQSDLAQISCVSEGTISKYIHKQIVPNIFSAINLACALDMTLDEFLFFGDTIDR